MAEICSICKQEFPDSAGYLNHVCTDGFTPVQPEHQGAEFQKISQAALKRGEERKQEELKAQSENTEQTA